MVQDLHRDRRLMGQASRSVAIWQRFGGRFPFQAASRQTGAGIPVRVLSRIAYRVLPSAFLLRTGVRGGNDGCSRLRPSTGFEHSSPVRADVSEPTHFERLTEGSDRHRRVAFRAARRPLRKNSPHPFFPSSTPRHSRVSAALRHPVRRFAVRGWFSGGDGGIGEVQDGLGRFRAFLAAGPDPGFSGAFRSRLEKVEGTGPDTRSGAAVIYMCSGLTRAPDTASNGVHACQACMPIKARGYCLLFHGSPRLNSPSRFFSWGVHRRVLRHLPVPPELRPGNGSHSTRGLAWDRWVE